MERLGNGVPAAPAEAKTRLCNLVCKTMRSTTMWFVVKWIDSSGQVEKK